MDGSQQPSSGPPAAYAGKAQSLVVPRALAVIRESLAADASAELPVSQLAGAAGVSRSTLERSFRRVLGCSPQAYMLRLRLDAARRALAEGAVLSVLDAALRHGFAHPGRFAIAYARAFGERPSATLRAARALPPLRPTASPALARIMLRALDAADGNQAAARRATDALAIALCRHRELALCDPEAVQVSDPRILYRLQGRSEDNGVTLQLVHPARGIVLWTGREPLRSRAGQGWADRAVNAIGGALAAQQAAEARRVPRHHADADTLVWRARAAALVMEREAFDAAFDLLGEALHRDPAHARAHALAASCFGQASNHGFTADPERSRAQAVSHAQQAILLSPDDPDVLTMAASAMSLARRLDEAETLARRSLALDPKQPAAWRRLGFIENFRGNGRLAVDLFSRAFHAWPHGRGGDHTLLGLGIAAFIAGDYPRSARVLQRAIMRSPARTWPLRFLSAAATRCGAGVEAQRALTAFRRAYPDLTVERLSRSSALHHDASGRVLDALATAGLPYS